MKLNELLDTVMSSDADDWHKIVCWGSTSGPSYKDQFTFWEKRDKAENFLDVESHSEVAIFIPDISISLAFGLKRSDKFQEKWANSFPDPDASSSYVDIFYNNALVFRTFYVVVDGGRAYLPVPHRTTLDVPRRYYGFIQLINSIQGERDYERYVKDAGMKVVEQDWPKL
jgi:hypothetical protein